MSDNAVLFTRPKYDLPTFYLHKWTEPLITAAGDAGLQILDLKEKDVTKEKFNGYMNTQNPRLVVLNGHGNADTVSGHDHESILERGDNESCTADKILYVRSCNAAEKLGESCVEKGGADAFIGHTKKFVIAHNGNRTADPMNDNLAAPVLQASNEAPKALIQGKTAAEAFERSQEKHQEKLEQALADYDLGTNQVFAALALNMESQTVIGNENASCST